MISRGGTLDTLNVPTTVSATNYNAANQLTQWGSAAPTYDLNGNLTGDGSNIYAWNARDQLISISGAQSQSVTYDGLGQRQSSTMSGATRSLLYDGLNLVQELNGGTPTVNYLTGANIDETFSATNSVGTLNYLTDILGSTVALANNGGTIQTGYTYDSYGNATTTGSSSSNVLQYTGRDNDGSGLYYYRARYYSPQWGRFVSGDPIGLAGGINEYAYASGNPTSLRDPLGLLSWGDPLPQSIVNYGVGLGDGIVNGASFGFLSLQSFRNLYNGGNGGADVCSAQYRNSFGGGQLVGLSATTGLATKLFLAAANVRSFAQASYVSLQLWTGAQDLALSGTEGLQLETQLEAIVEEAEEEGLSRPLLPVPGVPRY